MEKYRGYLKEKYNRKLEESPNGFIDYAIYPDRSMYIFTLFVSKESRDKGEAFALEQEIIQKEKPLIIFCDIDKDSNKWVKALVQICKKADYKVYNDLEDKVILVKEIKYEE